MYIFINYSVLFLYCFSYKNYIYIKIIQRILYKITLIIHPQFYSHASNNHCFYSFWPRLLFFFIRKHSLFLVFYIFAAPTIVSRICRIESTGWIMLLNATLPLASNSHDRVLFPFRIAAPICCAPRHFLLALYMDEYYVQQTLE